MQTDTSEKCWTVRWLTYLHENLVQSCVWDQTFSAEQRVSMAAETPWDECWRCCLHGPHGKAVITRFLLESECDRAAVIQEMAVEVTLLTAVLLFRWYLLCYFRLNSISFVFRFFVVQHIWLRLFIEISFKFDSDLQLLFVITRGFL